MVALSLTSLLNGKDEKSLEFQNIVDELIPSKMNFNTLSGKKSFSNEYELLCPYTLKNSYQASIVGAAFDYLARILTAKIITKNKDLSYINLVAHKGLCFLEKRIDPKLHKKLKDKYIKNLSIFIETAYSDLSPINNNFFDICYYDEEFKAFKLFLENSLHSEEKVIDFNSLCKAAYYFACLENIQRNGLLTENTIDTLLSSPPKFIIDDLKNLCFVFKNTFIDSNIITPDSTVIFNPTFGTILPLCIGGADADIYIDGVLYDFKTTKAYTYKKKDAAQIICYFLLHLGAIANGDKSPLNHYIIHRIAFYKSRFGEIEYVDTTSLKKDQILKVLKNLFAYFDLAFNSEFESYFTKYYF